MNGRPAIAAGLAAAVLLLSVSFCSAQIPEQMNYQVMLTNDLDQPLADQSVQLVFRIYNVESGGGQLWTETHNVVTSSIGVASVVLGSENPVHLLFSVPLWLQVEVDSEVLSPRRRLTSSPYSLSGGGGGTGDGHSLDADDGSPVDALYVDSNGDVGIGTTSPQAELHVSEEIQVGSTTTLGVLTVHGGSAANGAIRLQGEGVDGGSIYIDDGMGSTYVTLGPTEAAGGGKLSLGKNSAGDAGSGSFTGSVQSLDVRSISAPTSGYILAIGTVELGLYHTYNTSNNITSVQVGLTDGYPAIPASQNLVVSVPDRAGSGTYRQVATVHGSSLPPRE